MAFASLTGIRHANTCLVPQCPVCVCVCNAWPYTTPEGIYKLGTDTHAHLSTLSSSHGLESISTGPHQRVQGGNPGEARTHPKPVSGAPFPRKHPWSPRSLPVTLQTADLYASRVHLHARIPRRPCQASHHQITAPPPRPPAQELPHSLGRARRQHTHQAHTIPLAKGLSSPPPIFPQPPPRAGPITLQARAPPRWRGGGQGTPTGGPATSQGGEKAQD